MFLRNFQGMFAQCICIVMLGSLSLSVASQEKKIVPSGRSTVFEETITTSVIHTSKGLFSSTEESVEISAVLWTPEDKMGFKKPYPLVVYSHGGQHYGSDLPFSPSGPVAFFLSKGIAVYSPIRKGFSRRGNTPSTISVDKTEPVACGNFFLMDKGVASAKQDTLALVAKLKMRQDLDLNKIVLMGQSRGGFLSLALAADDFPGIVGVLNFAGGWHGETCQPSYNQTKMSEFGDKINVPIISLYGDSDSYFEPIYISGYLKSLSKNGKSEGRILPGYNHVRPVGDVNVWGEKAMLLFMEK